MKNSKKILFIKFFFLFLILSKNSHAEDSIYELYGNKILYKNNNEIIIAEGKAHAKDQFGKKIFAEKIIYDKKNSKINTENKSLYLDKKGNKLFADFFFYDLKSKIINAKKNILYEDKDGNKFYFTNLDYNENSEIGNGDNFKAKLLDKSSIEGSKAEFNNKTGILTVGKFEEENIIKKFFSFFNENHNSYTSCEIKNDTLSSIDQICPDWSISTTKTIHDKNKNMIYHYGSLLKIKNTPVFYTPYFSHPDPSVKRKSGFLPPVFKNFNELGQTLKTPYYWVIDKNKDLTLSPIYYFEENPIFLLEYQQQNKRSKIYVDTSYTKGYKNLNKNDTDGNDIKRTSGSRNHFFLNFLGSYDDLLFSKNDLEVNINRISQKNYLKVNEINTQYVRQDITALNNNIILNSYENNKNLTLKANIFENLNNENSNSKYEYAIPSIQYSNFFNKFTQNINQKNTFEIKNTGGDSTQTTFNNIFDTVSDQNILPSGINNTFKTSFKNYNKYNQNITGEKENLNNDLFFTAGIESSYPLMKISENNDQTIIPKIFSKFTSGSAKSSIFNNKTISYSDIYSLDRSNVSSSPETGANMGYGIEYNLTNKSSKQTVYSETNFSIGQIIRDKKINQSNDISTLSDTRSGFVGMANYFYDRELATDIISNNLNPNKFRVNLNYDYVISRNFDKFLKNQIGSDLMWNNNNLNINYYETHDIGNQHFLEVKYKKKINYYNFQIGTKKNIQENYTEHNFIEAFYESDCLKVSLNLTDKYFQNEELKPSKTINFTIEFKPFGNPISPDLSGFLK